jgi:ppGpp synthetase/RelA/SpoT-type nucleotidyltranferase
MSIIVDFENYERTSWADYADLAQTVGTILSAAIRREPQLRLQHVKTRAKAPHSLKQKLADRGIADTKDLENDIKDLAGCRVIFYTNADVTAFINSRLMPENFEIISVNIHYPKSATRSASELFISNNYLVALKTERTSLPEYARFANMRCEVQIQTILNHAWAEMAHDTIYKKPRLDGFGGKAFEAIERRMDRVMRDHLLPAGYDFQKIASDFERLLAGKELFDQQPLDAILEAPDNNERFDAIERLADHVLPLYDDLSTDYPAIVKALAEAVEHARAVPVKPIETPYGSFDGKTAEDVGGQVIGILERYRYLDIDVTFDALIQLFKGATTEKERTGLTKLGEKIAAHDLAVWKLYGPVAQTMVLDRVEALESSTRFACRTLITAMLGEILKPEVSGTTNNSDSITIHRGAVTVSDALRAVRRRAIAQLRELLGSGQTGAERELIVQALFRATDSPHNAAYGNELALVIAENSLEIVGIYREFAPGWGFELLQSMEDRMLHLHYRSREVPDFIANDPALAKAYADLLPLILAFRDEINADPEFVIYKTLVGYDSVFPGAWDGDPFDFEARDAWRNERIPAMVAEITEENAEHWLLIITRCAQTESNDLATFPSFGTFLAQLAEAKPTIVLGYLRSLDPKLVRFIPGMLRGLTQGGAGDTALTQLAQWIDAGDHLSDIAFYFRNAAAFDQPLLEKLLYRAVGQESCDAVLETMFAAASQFTSHPGTLIDTVFLPALAFLVQKDDLRWARAAWFPWHASTILTGLDEAQAQVVLDALVPLQSIEYRTGDMLIALTAKWPEKLIQFFGARLEWEANLESRSDYTALPFSIHQLQKPLAAMPALMVTTAREWFGKDQPLFQYHGGHFLAAVFPDYPADFKDELASQVRTGEPENIKFVIAVLANYEGSAAIHKTCKDLIDQLDEGDKLLSSVRLALGATGMVTGEFGFVEAYEQQKAQIATWLSDPRIKVQNFAKGFVRSLEQSIADEQRRAEESQEIRRRDWGEDEPGN